MGAIVSSSLTDAGVCRSAAFAGWALPGTRAGSLVQPQHSAQSVTNPNTPSGPMALLLIVHYLFYSGSLAQIGKRHARSFLLSQMSPKYIWMRFLAFKFCLGIRAESTA